MSPTYVSCLLYPVSCTMSLEPCLLNHISCLLFPVFYLLSLISCLQRWVRAPEMIHVLRACVSKLYLHASCLKSPVSCLMSPVSCLLSHISCLTTSVAEPESVGAEVFWLEPELI